MLIEGLRRDSVKDVTFGARCQPRYEQMLKQWQSQKQLESISLLCLSELRKICETGIQGEEIHQALRLLKSVKRIDLSACASDQLTYFGKLLTLAAYPGLCDISINLCDHKKDDAGLNCCLGPSPDQLIACLPRTLVHLSLTQVVLQQPHTFQLGSWLSCQSIQVVLYRTLLVPSQY